VINNCEKHQKIAITNFMELYNDPLMNDLMLQLNLLFGFEIDKDSSIAALIACHNNVSDAYETLSRGFENERLEEELLKKEKKERIQ